MTQFNYPNRKLPRLQDYDYAQEGAYFVTICTHHRDNLFGDISRTKMNLNERGEIAQTCWLNIPDHFSIAELDLFVIMPNHMHGIILITDKSPSNSAIGKRHAFSLPQSKSQPKSKRQVSSGSLPAIIGSYKSAVTKRINQTLGVNSPKVWQVSYHDHIIRGEQDLNRIREYVLTNPARWENDRYYDQHPTK